MIFFPFCLYVEFKFERRTTPVASIETVSADGSWKVVVEAWSISRIVYNPQPSYTSNMQPIPAVWRIDIEPDDFQPGSESAAWDGFVTMAELVERLRGRLGDRSGVPIRPTWFIRLDPDIERCFGRTDFIVHRNREHIDRLLARGDPVGIHTHFYRWDEQGHHSYTDVADDAWDIECLDVGATRSSSASATPSVGRARADISCPIRSWSARSHSASRWT